MESYTPCQVFLPMATTLLLHFIQDHIFIFTFICSQFTTITQLCTYSSIHYYFAVSNLCSGKAQSHRILRSLVDSFDHIDIEAPRAHLVSTVSVGLSDPTKSPNVYNTIGLIYRVQ